MGEHGCGVAALMKRVAEDHYRGERMEEAGWRWRRGRLTLTHNARFC